MSRPNNDELDLTPLIDAQVAAKEAALEQAAQLARSNRIEARKAQFIEDLKSEVGRVIVDVRELKTVVEAQTARVDRILSSQTFLDLALLSTSVREANEATQRLLDHVVDAQNLILELLRFILSHVKINGEKARLQEASKSLPGHPAEVEDSRPEVEHVRRLLSLQHRTLQMLEEESAHYGISVPLATRHGIEAARKRITELQEQLMDLLEEDNEDR